MNAPETFDRILLAPGEQKVTYTPDTKVPNAGTFRINREDHTLGNMLASQLRRDPRVLFSGYRCPHPLEHHLLLRIQTTPDYSPKEALKTALADCRADITRMTHEFETEVKRVQGMH